MSMSLHVAVTDIDAAAVGGALTATSYDGQFVLLLLLLLSLSHVRKYGRTIDMKV